MSAVGVSGVESHAKTVMDWMEASWREGMNLDTTLIGEQGSIPVRCHLLMLTSVSNVLEKIIIDMEEDVTILIPDTSSHDLQMFLQFIYTGSLCSDSSSVMKLIQTLNIPFSKPNICRQHETMLHLGIPQPTFPLQKSSEISGSVQEVQSNQSFSCPVCLKKYETKAILSKHMVTHLGEFKCDPCNHLFPSRSDLEEHVQKVHSMCLTNDQENKQTSGQIRRGFMCNKCDEVFRWRTDLRRHSEVVHGQKMSDLVPCSVCNKLIVAKRLNEHIKSVHCNEKPFACQQCDKKFGKPSELRNHVRSHTGERPFKCDICNATFAYSHILTRHKKYHQGAKNFPCKFCDKSFLQKNDLVKHSRIHSGEKPYSCDICGKDFARMDYLKKHHMLHSNDSKFCCNECGELCASADDLKKHKTNSHRPNIELNSFDDLALQLPGLEIDSIHDSIQAVTIDGGKTIMILNEMDPLDTSQDSMMSGSGSAELVLTQSGLTTDTDAAPVLYAVQY